MPITVPFASVANKVVRIKSELVASNIKLPSYGSRTSNEIAAALNDPLFDSPHDNVPKSVGEIVGLCVGIVVGADDGAYVGAFDGSTVGFAVGFTVGLIVGDDVVGANKYRRIDHASTYN